MAEFIESNTHFLKRDELYDTEKPYTLRFDPPNGFPRANIKLEKREILVQDIRRKNGLSFAKDGLALLSFNSKMKYDDFDNDEVVKSVYLKEVSNFLKTLLGAQHVQIFEHTVRKRHEIFPISTGEPYRYNQPTSIAHLDTTVEWAIAMAKQLNPEKASEIVKHRIQCVNVWKPLKGPVQDWPLGLCYPATVDQRRDFEPCDLVYPDYVVENRQIYYAERQKWLYASDQMQNEAWVFSQSDSAFISNPIVHTAFPLPGVNPKKVPARESIEVRALVYYGGFDQNVDMAMSMCGVEE